MPATPEKSDIERVFFAFRDSQTGDLVRACGENRSDYRLSNDSNDPIFEVKTPEDLAMVLFENTPSYNSSSQYPNWGPFSRERLVPARVAIRTCIEPVELPQPRRVQTLEVRTMLYMVARRYAGRDIPQVMPDGRLAFWLVELPEGMTLDDAKAWEGHVVYAGDEKYLSRTLYMALPVPPDYQPELAGRNAALFLASTL